MRYKIEFEFDTEQKNPQNWYWGDLLSGVEDEDTTVDTTTIAVFKNAGWERI